MTNFETPLHGQCLHVAGLLKQLAHPNRLQILCQLSGAEMTVGELEQHCGASQSQVSQFLNRMKSEGLVDARREGKFVYYRIADPQVVQLILALHKVFA